MFAMGYAISGLFSRPCKSTKNGVVTKKLFYHYDYGDGWVVEITRRKSCDDLLQRNLLSKDELDKAYNKVYEDYQPVCIHQDGIFVLDDVGGMGGYVRMLRTLYESKNADEKKEVRQWASGLGWSARRVSNDLLL